MTLALHVSFPERAVLSASVSRKLASRVLRHSRPHADNYVFRERTDGRVHVRDIFTCRNVVPDVDRYRLRRHAGPQGCTTRTRGQWFLEAHPTGDIPCDPYNDRRIADGTNYASTIIVVLESPHRHEYADRDLARPIAPACGVTGIKLQDVLLDMLIDNDAEIRENARVIISNPVPFQTSLDSLYDRTRVNPYTREKVRDEVWTALWLFDPIRRNFLDRIRAYAPYLAINACTAACSQAVSVAISQLGVGQLYESDHPSKPGSWTDQEHTMSPYQPRRSSDV